MKGRFLRTYSLYLVRFHLKFSRFFHSELFSSQAGEREYQCTSGENVTKKERTQSQSEHLRKALLLIGDKSDAFESYLYARTLHTAHTACRVWG